MMCPKCFRDFIKNIYDYTIYFSFRVKPVDDNYNNVNWRYVNIFGDVLLNYLINNN